MTGCNEMCILISIITDLIYIKRISLNLGKRYHLLFRYTCAYGLFVKTCNFTLSLLTLYSMYAYIYSRVSVFAGYVLKLL